MGYTNYWQQSEKFTDEEFKKIEDHTQGVVKKSILDDKIWIEFTRSISYRPEGEKYIPYIKINGNSDLGQDHESFIFENKISDFEFCKTNRKPYDWVVWFVLLIAHEIAPSKISIKNDDGESMGTWLNSKDFENKVVWKN